MSGQAHQPLKKTGAAERMRRLRVRRRIGARCFYGDASQTVVASLIRCGWLSPEEAMNPRRLGEAIVDLADCAIGGRLGPLGERTTTRNSKARKGGGDAGCPPPRGP